MEEAEPVALVLRMVGILGFFRAFWVKMIWEFRVKRVDGRWSAPFSRAFNPNPEIIFPRWCQWLIFWLFSRVFFLADPRDSPADRTRGNKERRKTPATNNQVPFCARASAQALLYRVRWVKTSALSLAGRLVKTSPAGLVLFGSRNAT